MFPDTKTTTPFWLDIPYGTPRKKNGAGDGAGDAGDTDGKKKKKKGGAKRKTNRTIKGALSPTAQGHYKEGMKYLTGLGLPVEHNRLAAMMGNAAYMSDAGWGQNPVSWQQFQAQALGFPEVGVNVRAPFGFDRGTGDLTNILGGGAGGGRGGGGGGKGGPYNPLSRPEFDYLDPYYTSGKFIKQKWRNDGGGSGFGLFGF